MKISKKISALDMKVLTPTEKHFIKGGAPAADGGGVDNDEDGLGD